MSYRCDICGIKVPPKQQRLVHQVFKARRDGALIQPRQLAKELGCCEGCHLMLDEVPLRSVKDPYYLRPRKFRDVDHATVEYVPPPPPATGSIGRPARTATL